MDRSGISGSNDLCFNKMQWTLTKIIHEANYINNLGTMTLQDEESMVIQHPPSWHTLAQ